MTRIFTSFIFILTFATPCAAEKLLCVTKFTKTFSYDETTKQREVKSLGLQRRYIIEPSPSNGNLAISIVGNTEPFITCPAVQNNLLGYTRCSNESGTFKFNNYYKRFTYLHAYSELEDGGNDPNSPSVEFGRCTIYQES